MLKELNVSVTTRADKTLMFGWDFFGCLVLGGMGKMLTPRIF